MRLKVYKTEPHPDVAGTYNNLGAAWKSKGNYDRAIEFYEKAVNILRELRMTDHPDFEKYKRNLERARNEKLENNK
ncbi:MAG: tetratricopeptide repeat protein, partial [Nitrospirae bacterium]|nr:tetratricopeptide repeat protein [Nitrospirota bacterium]